MPRTALILKTCLVVFFFFTFFLPLKKHDIFGLLIYYAPYIIALCLPSKYTSFAAGLCLGAVIIELPFTAFFSFFGGIFPDPKAFVPLRILSLLLLIVAVAGSVVCYATPKNERGNIYIGIGLSSLYIVVATASGIAATRSNAGFPVPATEILGKVDKCALAFVKQYGGTFPDELSGLGPRGTACLDQNFADGRLNGLKITYSVESTEGKRSHYHVILERNTWFNTNEPSYYSDESGIVYHSFGGHIASPRDRTEPNVAGTVRAIGRCLIDRQKSSSSFYPSSIAEFPKDGSSYCSLEFMTDKLKYHSYGSRISYEASLAQQRAVGFILRAQPQEYGRDGVRSYFTDETGIVHGTPENRPAGPQDPPIPSCEYNSNPCATSQN